MHMTLSLHFAEAIILMLTGLGWDEASARAALNAPKAPKRGGRLPVSHLIALLDAAEVALDDPLIGLRVGERFRVSAFGDTGAIYAYARDLPDVADLNARYQRLTVDIGDIGYRVTDEGEHYMEFAPYYADDLQSCRHISGVLMGAYATAYAWLSWGSGHALKSVHLPFDPPDTRDAQRHAEALLRCPVRFGTDRGRLEFAPGAVAQPLPTHDAEKRALTIARLDAMLDVDTKERSFTRALHQAIRAGLDAGPLNAEILYARMEMSKREWRAAMRAADLGYQSELDAVRRALFAEGVQANLSFADIAGRLGYNDQAALNRAVRRWYDVAPSEWTPDLPLVVSQ